jgi:threonine/homoserine/homoserine lactone efflux protein
LAVKTHGTGIISENELQFPIRNLAWPGVLVQTMNPKCFVPGAAVHSYFIHLRASSALEAELRTDWL